MERYLKNLLEMYHESQVALVGLYTVYAQRFPEKRAFWTRFAEEKRKQADAFRALATEAEEGGLSFDEGRVRTYTLKTFLGYVDRVARLAERGLLDARHAVVLALDIEHSLIEKDLFEHFSYDVPEKNLALDHLREETWRRVRELEELLAQFG